MRRAFFLEHDSMKFPMILTHRDNPHAQIVIATAEQLADVPEEFLPPGGTAAPAVVTAAAAIPGVNLDTAEDTERRQSLEEAVDEFTAHVQAETAKIDAAHAQLDADRAALEEQADALSRERAEFEAQRAAATGEIAGDAGAASATAEGAATGDTATPPAAPAKRTRSTKEGA
jgi:hypothetical protein